MGVHSIRPDTVRLMEGRPFSRNAHHTRWRRTPCVHSAGASAPCRRDLCPDRQRHRFVRWHCHSARGPSRSPPLAPNSLSRPHHLTTCGGRMALASGEPAPSARRGETHLPCKRLKVSRPSRDRCCASTVSQLADVDLRIGEQSTRSDKSGRFLLRLDSLASAIARSCRSMAHLPTARGGAVRVLRSGRASRWRSYVSAAAYDLDDGARHGPCRHDSVADDSGDSHHKHPYSGTRASSSREDGDPRQAPRIEVTQVTITPIPVDRPPFPLPARSGRADLFHDSTGRVAHLRVWELHPGRATPLSELHVAAGWNAGGLLALRTGRAGMVHLWRRRRGFVGAAGHSRSRRLYLPVHGSHGDYGGNPCGRRCPYPNGPEPADPVDAATGLFVMRKTDLLLRDVLPLVFSRTYRPADNTSRSFGIGTTHAYDFWLWRPSLSNYDGVALILPDGYRINYDRIDGGTGFVDMVLEHTSTPTAFYKSRITWNGNGFDLKLKNGTVLVFGDNAPLQSIRDRFGNTITFRRPTGQGGPIARIVSPNGRSDRTHLRHGAEDYPGHRQHRTHCHVHIPDTGRLWKVTDPAGGVTGVRPLTRPTAC